MAFIEKGQEIDIEAIKLRPSYRLKPCERKKPAIESWQPSSRVRTTESFW